MPVTSLALLVFSAAAAAVVTLFAVSTWGWANVVPVLLFIALAARWAMADVPHDDGQT